MAERSSRETILLEMEMMESIGSRKDVQGGNRAPKTLAVLLFVLVALTLAGCKKKLTSAADQPVPVRVEQVHRIQQAESVSVSGSVEANVMALSAFQVAGRVERVYVEVGQAVRKGQVLAELDASDYNNAYKAAAGQAGAAEAVNAKAQAGLRQQELEQARIDFDRWQDEYNRMKYLYEHKSLAANDFNKIEAGYKAARERYEMARQGARVEDKRAASEESHAASAGMDEARKRLGDCKLRAPIAGMIGMRQVDVGNTVAAGMPVISVLDLDPVKVKVGIPESEIGKVHVGSPATVTIPSLDGQKFEGKVEAISVASDPASRTYEAKIVVANHDHVLRAGMVSEARLIGSRQVNAITVPGTAIQQDARGVAQVFIYQPGQNRVYARRVEVGAMIGNEVEIRSGLDGSEQIVVDGRQNVREGSLVKIEGGSR